MSLQKTIYRNIIELSIMVNNDEYVFYSSAPVKDKDELVARLKTSFNDPKFVMERPLQESEKETLNLEYKGPLYDK